MEWELHPADVAWSQQLPLPTLSVICALRGFLLLTLFAFPSFSSWVDNNNNNNDKKKDNDNNNDKKIYRYY